MAGAPAGGERRAAVNFVSAQFALFLAGTYAAYWLSPPGDGRKYLLLAASYLFYAAWDWRFCGLLAFVTVNAHLAGSALARRPEPVRSRLLCFSLAADLAVLGWFKYAGFLAAGAVSGLAALGIESGFRLPEILLPIGISFYTFHAMSYVIDVHRGKVAARGLGDVALYIAFFPQLVAGPIIRAGFFMPQLGRVPPFSATGQALGLRLIVKGLIYKALIADGLAGLVDPAFARIGQADDSALTTATIAFYGQIYFDFAGYSALAIGTARLFGYRVPKNFDYPYSALSLTEFWRRWHMSLSFWLRDYVYIPLGGNRGPVRRVLANLMATMILGGLWHGASWNFVLWGTLHGLGLCLHKLWLGVRPPRPGPVFWVWRALALAATQLWVLAAWVFFRCPGFGDAIQVLQALAGVRQGAGPVLPAAGLWILALVAADHLLGRFPRGPTLAPVLVRPIFWAGLGAVAALVSTSLPLVQKAFLYFQF
jgi:alginate O-acetyltransferase complex protein AlgI